jgi:O-methyltransferase
MPREHIVVGGVAMSEEQQEPSDLPTLPWRERIPQTLRYLRATSGPDVPLGTLWDLAPERAELRRPGQYLRSLRLWECLLNEGYTMLSCRRGRALYRLADAVRRRGVPGALVDCGVWNGGSTILLAAAAAEREAWAFDSFEGLPAPGPEDPEEEWWEGEVRGDAEMLQAGFEEYVPSGTLHVVPGWFRDTFPRVASQISDVAVLHADGDFYDSVRLTLETFYPKLVPGGYAVIDDYGGFVGARRATDEFRRDHAVAEPLRWIDYTGVYWRKH